MRAIVIEGSDLKLRTDVATPTPGAEQLLVRIHAAGINYVDLMRKPSHFGDHAGAAIAGIEFAGEVVGMGDAVQGFKVGDRVMAMDTAAYAEYACIDHRLAAHVPANLDWAQAAAVMVSFMTAHNALCTYGQFVPGDSVLLAGCTTGVGIAAAQIASWNHASCVIGTSTTAAKLDEMKNWGVTVPVLAPGQSVTEAVNKATGGQGVRIIIDSIGGAAMADNTNAAAILGRWISVGRLNGKGGEIDLNEIARKRLALIGVTFRTRTLAERITIVERLVAEVLPGIASGAIKPKLAKVFALEEADAAQQYVRAGKHFGKVVLKVPV